MVTWERELSLILEKEITILDGISRCAGEKTELLVTGDVDGINKMLGREQPLSMQCQTVEAQRLELLRKYRMSGATLREMCGKACAEYKDILTQQLKELSDKVGDIKRKNKLNSELTKTRLEFYGKLRAISKPVYGYDGKSEHSAGIGKSLIDQKI